MAIVIETLNRRGRVLNSQYFAKNTITIGRSFENDYIVDDHYVDPCHIEVSVSNDQFVCNDKNSINGLYNRKRKRLNSPYFIEDGGEIFIGKTLLRIGSTRSITTPAVKLAFVESVGEFLASLPVAIVSFSLLLLCAIFEIEISAFDLDEYAYSVIIFIGVSVLLLAGFFAFLGRVLRHDSRFLLYFSLINGIAILSYLYDFIRPLIFFNLSYVQVDGVIDDLIYSVLFALLLYVALRFATRLRVKGLLIIASIAPLLMLVNVFVPDTGLENFDVYAPPYDALVRHESLYLGERLSHEAFQTSAQSLYKLDGD